MTLDSTTASPYGGVCCNFFVAASVVSVLEVTSECNKHPYYITPSAVGDKKQLKFLGKAFLILLSIWEAN